MFRNTFIRNADEPSSGGAMQDMFKPVDAPAPTLPTEPTVTDPAQTDPPAPETPPAPDAPEEGLNPDGTLQDGYTRNEFGAVVKKEESTEPTEPEETVVDDVDTVIKFYEEVDKITGTSIEVEYPEGVHPSSVEGIAHREMTIRERAMEALDDSIRTNMPRVYAYMLHTQNGGSDEEFWDKSGPALPTYEQFKESGDMQAAYFKNNLIAKGIDEDIAEAQVQKAIKENTLFTKADAIYQADKTAEANSIAQLQADKEKQENEIREVTTGMKEKLNEFIGTGLQFAVPEAGRSEFQKYVLNNMQYDPETKKFFIIQDINEKNMGTMMNSLFFQYKGGDLKQLIQKQATTKAAQNLQLRLGAGNPTPGAGKSTPAPTNGLTLGSLFKPV